MLYIWTVSFYITKMELQRKLLTGSNKRELFGTNIIILTFQYLVVLSTPSSHRFTFSHRNSRGRGPLSPLFRTKFLNVRAHYYDCHNFSPPSWLTLCTHYCLVLFLFFLFRWPSPVETRGLNVREDVHKPPPTLEPTTYRPPANLTSN